MVKKSVAEVQEYVYSLHQEIDLLTNKILKENSNSKITNEILKKISDFKCRCKDVNLKEQTMSKSRK